MGILELIDDIRELYVRKEGIGMRGKMVGCKEFIKMLEEGRIIILDLYGDEIKVNIKRKEEIEILLKWYKRGIVSLIDNG